MNGVLLLDKYGQSHKREVEYIYNLSHASRSFFHVEMKSLHINV